METDKGVLRVDSCVLMFINRERLELLKQQATVNASHKNKSFPCWYRAGCVIFH